MEAIALVLIALPFAVVGGGMLSKPLFCVLSVFLWLLECVFAVVLLLLDYIPFVRHAKKAMVSAYERTPAGIEARYCSLIDELQEKYTRLVGQLHEMKSSGVHSRDSVYQAVFTRAREISTRIRELTCERDQTLGEIRSFTIQMRGVVA